jgi:hypothetical protein
MAWPDRITPTGVWLVSRAWIIDEVAARGVDPDQQAALVDELTIYEPKRQHGLRNAFIFWLVAIASSQLADAVGLPRWTGFIAALLFFLWIARELAIRAVRWRLDQLLTDTQR